MALYRCHRKVPNKKPGTRPGSFVGGWTQTSSSIALLRTAPLSALVASRA